MHGYMDFYVTNSGRDTQNALFMNQGDGTFIDYANNRLVVAWCKSRGHNQPLVLCDRPLRQSF